MTKPHKKTMEELAREQMPHANGKAVALAALHDAAQHAKDKAVRHLWMVNTRTCNLDCSYCYQGSHKWTWQASTGLAKMMPDAVMEATVAWLTQWSPDAVRITWYGGEPLLSFAQMRSYAPVLQDALLTEGKGLRWSVTTNGTLLRAEQRAFMDEYGFGMLLSLDGPPWLHDKTRTYYGGSPSWATIKPLELLAWRPKLEVAWQLDPDVDFSEADLDWMILNGFKSIAFNVNWLKEWSYEAQERLFRFMRHAGRRALAGDFGTNWIDKLNKSLARERPEQPCGTGGEGCGSLAVTPEGWLYPSQEMAFSAMEPDRAEGTAEYYRVGNVLNDPVLDVGRQQIVGSIRNDEMVTPPGYDCNECVAKPVSFGGCHCRYVGQRPGDPSYRYDVPLGHCQSTRSALLGMLAAASIDRYIKTKPMKEFRQEKSGLVQLQVPARPPNGTPNNKRVDVGDVFSRVSQLELMLKRIEQRLDEAPVVRVEEA